MDYENLYTQGHRVWLFSPFPMFSEKSCATNVRTGTPGLTVLTAEPDFFPTFLCNQDIWAFNSLGVMGGIPEGTKSIMKMKGVRAVGGTKGYLPSLQLQLWFCRVSEVLPGPLMPRPWQSPMVSGQKGIRSAPSNHGDNHISICPERGVVWRESH